MTLRDKTRPLVNHIAAADGLREMPGLWLPVGRYASLSSAEDMARQVQSGRLMAYAPAGSFTARVEYVDGEPTLVACYLGEPAQPGCGHRGEAA